MRRTSLLPLIGLVLLLSAVTPLAKAQQQVESKPGSASEKQQPASAGLPASPSYSAIQTPVAEHTANQQQTRADQKLTTYDKLSLMAQYLIFLATLIYAFIANRQLKAINASAKAASLSATAALQGNRPILVIAEVKLLGFNEPASRTSSVREVHASFEFQNRGTGIAFVKNIAARLAFEDEPQREANNLMFFSDPMIAPEKATPRLTVPSTYGLIIDDARRHAMTQLSKQLQLRGRIDYTDMAQQDHWTKFAYGYSLVLPDNQGHFYRLVDGNEYDVYAEDRWRYQQESKTRFAKLKSFFQRKRTNRPVTHNIRR